MIPSRHPRYPVLCRFVDGELEGDRAGRVRQHLARCRRCRAEVEFLRALAREARQLPAPRPPEELLEQIRERRARGDRLILPEEVPPAPASRSGRFALVAASLLLLAAALLWPRGELQGDRSRLLIGRQSPAPGDSLPVRYEPRSHLARRDSLVLRAELRVGDDPELPEEASVEWSRSVLRREGDSFVGTLRFPADAEYARLAVETPDAESIDANHRRFWNVLAHGQGGRPTFAALRHRFAAAHGQGSDGDWRTVREAAHELTREYPERAESWLLRLWAERITGATVAEPALQEEHRERLARFDRRLASRPLDADEVAAMMEYAAALGASEIEAWWWNRLRREAPGHPAVGRRMLLEHFADWRTAGVAVERLDSLWSVYGPGLRGLAEIGFSLVETAPRATAVRWAARLERARPEQRLQVAASLAARPATREAGVERLRRLAAELAAGGAGPRPLGVTAAGWREHTIGRRQRVLTTLGRALVAAGRQEEGLETLSRAAELAWSPAAARALAEAALAAGDTGRALEAWASVAVDPARTLGGGDAAAPAPQRIFAASGGAERAARLAAARAARDRTVLRGLEMRRVDAEPVLEDGTGRTTTLREAAARGPLLVVYAALPVALPPDGPRLAEVATACRLVESAGGGCLLAVAFEPDSALAAGVTRLGLASWVDRDLEVAPALDLPFLFGAAVLDRKGRIRLTGPELQPALRAAVVLSGSGDELPSEPL